MAGGTASGKSTVCKRIIEKLGQADINERQRQVRRKLFMSMIFYVHCQHIGCVYKSR